MALMPVGPSKFIRRTIEIKHNRVKNPNWPEANQLAIYNREQMQLAVRVEIRYFLRCSRAATVKKCTKKRAARAKLLFGLLKLLRLFPFLFQVCKV